MDTLFANDHLDQVRPESPGKTLNVYRNGKLDVITTLKIKDSTDLSNTAKYLTDKFRFQPSDKLRLFTVEGVEMSPEDLRYLKHESSIFVSKGENFHKSSKLCEYVMMRKLGQGSFGEVSLAAHKITKQLVAIKFIKRPNHIDAMKLDKIFAEAETVRQLQHKNIVEMINCFPLQDLQVALVMEYLEGGTLLDYVKSKKRLPEDEARHFFVQMMEAIAYCHYKQVIHCDLKMENILLKSSESKEIKLIDFGIAGLVKSRIGGGTFHHMAPEILNGKKKNIHGGIDIWAAGCILYEMVTGKWPFDGESKEKIKERILAGKFSFFEMKKELSPGIMDLIKKMLQVDVEKRINVRDILAHPWVINADANKSKDKGRGFFEIKNLPKAFDKNIGEKEEI